MSDKINCIMLVDDNPDDNFFHERIIKKNNFAETVVSVESGFDALDYLKNKKVNTDHPDLIFLDINMPKMNGWEFLEEYKKLDKDLQSSMIVVMLTTSDNPDDMALAKTKEVLSDFKTKPLTKEMMEGIVAQYFAGKNS